MRALAAVEPDGLGIVDEDVVDGSCGFCAHDWDKARLETRSRGRGQIGGDWFAGLSEG